MRLLKAINLKSPINIVSLLRPGIGCLLAAAVVLPILIMFPTTGEATPVDIEAGVKAATEPLIKVLDGHWGKALFFIFCGGAVIGGGSKIKLNEETDKRSKK